MWELGKLSTIFLILNFSSNFQCRSITCYGKLLSLVLRFACFSTSNIVYKLCPNTCSNIKQTARKASIQNDDTFSSWNTPWTNLMQTIARNVSGDARYDVGLFDIRGHNFERDWRVQKFHRVLYISEITCPRWQYEAKLSTSSSCNRSTAVHPFRFIIKICKSYISVY
jgi:hypothetical protein